jgi:peptidoglycan-N-acetylglucosamine deacetylase
MKGSINMKITKNKVYSIILIIVFFIVCTPTKGFCTKNEGIFIKNGPRDKKYLAITFDDGPHPKETDEVLDMLKKHNVKATFFIAGKHANWYSKPLIRASKEGHEIGNHTFSHPDISNLSNSQLENEILKCEEQIIKLTGKKPELFRPPYGSYKENELANIAKKHGYKVVLWTTVDAKDWKNPGALSIADTIINNAKNGDIILLHDYATNNTVEALDIFIPEMQKKGYKFVTVSQLDN